MKEYKQFHDSDKKFNFQTMVYFCEANDSKQLSFYDLLKIASDGAVEDYNQQGMSREMLTENGFAILVSRLSFRFHRMPRENEAIVLKTCEEKSEALQLVRSYEFESMDGESLISGLGGWVVVRPADHKIVPTKMFQLRPAVDLQTEHDCLKYGKIAHPDDSALSLFDERVIKYSDLDGNGHTNNARYGAFIADALPENLRHVAFKDFRLNYAKEAKLGQKVQVFGNVNEETKRLFLVGKTDDGVSFEAELFW